MRYLTLGTLSDYPFNPLCKVAPLKIVSLISVSSNIFAYFIHLA